MGSKTKKGNMVKILTLLLLVLLLSVSITISCAPASAPSTPSGKPSPAPVSTLVTVPASPAPEEIAWEKLVQAAKQEGRLTIYSYSLVGDIGIAVSRRFSEKYGITLSLVSGTGAQIVERIRTEQRSGQVAASVVDAAPATIYLLKDANFTVSSAEVPVLQQKDVWLIDPKGSDQAGHILANRFYFHSAYINTRLVKAGDEPRSLKELTQPKWAGKMVIADPTFASTPYTFFSVLLRHKNIDLETVRAVGRNNVKFAINANLAAMDVAKGDYAIDVGSADPSYAPLILASAPVKAIPFEEGTVVAISAIAALNKAPHPNAAKLFINWLLTQEGQTVYLKEEHSLSPRKDVPDFRTEASRLTPTRLVTLTAEDYMENAKAVSDRVLVKLWKE